MTESNDFYTCIICGGDGYEYEWVDDNREKRPCPCRGKDYVRHITSHKTANELKQKGINAMNELPHAEKLNKAMDNYLLLHCEDFTSDHFRKFCKNDKSLEKVHNNSWGAIFSRYAKRGILTKTGEYRKSARPTSHGRVIPVWQIN
jgi:hypothetical protein